jgi:hypothetical protein
MATSWKTTASSIVTAATGLVVFLSTQGVQLPHWLVVTAGFVAAGGMASLGLNAKDHDVTGGTKPQ